MSDSLRRALSSEDSSVRAGACRASVDDPSAVLLIDALVQALADPDKGVARAASDALLLLSETHAEVRVALRDAQRSENPRLRWGGAYTSARISPPQPDVLPILVEAMSSREGDVRWAAAHIAVDLARLHDEALRAILQLVEAGDSPAQRRMAIFCLRDLAPDDSAAAQVLIRASRDADLHLRRAAFTAIGALTTTQAEVGARLLEAIRGDSDPASRRVAALALGQLGGTHPGAVSESTKAELRQIGTSCPDRDLGRAIELALAKLRS